MPDGFDHGLDGFEVADIAGECVDRTVRGKFGRGLFENFFAAAADVDCGAKFEEALGHGFAESSATAGDEDAFGVEEIVAEHGRLSHRAIV